jgi:hypothetical protein
MPRTPASAIGFPDVSGVPARLSPPPDLSPDERQIFVDIVASAKPEAFRASDLPLLSAYCRAIALEARSAQELAAGAGKEALASWNGAVKAMLGLAMRLRLSPQSRQPNLPGRAGGKPPRELSYFERQALLEEQNGSA